MKVSVFSLFVSFLLGVVSAGQAQELSVNGGNIAVAITTGIAGGEPLSVINTATTLRYRRQTVIAKITVTTICPGQRFTLKVVATTVGSGIAAPEVTLINGMLPIDFLTSIPVKPPGGNQNATLQYTASTTFAQGNSAELGDDIHTVTYTLVAQ